MCSVSSTTVKAFGLCSFNHRTSATALFYNTTHTDEEELPWWLSVEQNLPAMQETWVLIPGSGRSSGVGNGNPLQYPCLENSMDR